MRLPWILPLLLAACGAVPASNPPVDSAPGTTADILVGQPAPDTSAGDQPRVLRALFRGAPDPAPSPAAPESEPAEPAAEAVEQPAPAAAPTEQPPRRPGSSRASPLLPPPRPTPRKGRRSTTGCWAEARARRPTRSPRQRPALWQRCPRLFGQQGRPWPGGRPRRQLAPVRHGPQQRVGAGDVPGRLQ